MTLEVEGASCAAGHRVLFDNATFTLPAGHWLMLTGANGSGKTTLLRTLAGLVRPLACNLRWRDRPMQPRDPQWHAQLVYVGHLAGFKNELSAHENLALQLALDEPSAGARPLTALLEQVGLARQRGLAFARMSAGQRRRLGLARLAASRRPLWLLDEPTTALDAEGQGLLGRLLDAHLQRGGCAVVATHQPLPWVAPAQALDMARFAVAQPRAAAGPVGLS